MNIDKAIVLSLGDMTNSPVITKFQIGVLIHELYRKKRYRGEPIEHLKKDWASRSDVSRCIKNLTSSGVLTKYRNIPNTYALLGRRDSPIEEVLCTIDPFCHISHLSAMAFHGLTDRIPSKTFISTPPQKQWTEKAKETMQGLLANDYDTYFKNGLPNLVRVDAASIPKLNVHCFRSKQIGGFKSIQDRALRVSGIGRTFLEMLREPQLCGGIRHVLNVFNEHGPRYFRLAAQHIDTHGSPIDKVRAGYIFDEQLNIKSEIIDGWVKLAQRGGSRRLDPGAEYSSDFSEKWMISLNA